MNPVIGLIPLYDDEKESYWMLPGYMKVLEQCGALPIMLPLTGDKAVLEQAFSMCDGLLLTGGHDVGTYVYGKEPVKECGIPCRARDEMESIIPVSESLIPICFASFVFHLGFPFRDFTADFLLP